VLAHHPYSVGSPETRALNDDDVSIPDLGKLTRLLRAAERTGGALPHIHHPTWVTEVSYDSSPPDPQGVPIATHARWLEQTLEVLARAGVTLITWNQVGDQPPIPSYAATNQSGVYYLEGGIKPALTAFRFPLVARRTRGHAVEVWGRAPTAGQLVLEQRAGGAWRQLGTLPVNTHATFSALLGDIGATTLRARVAGDLSLSFRLG
jgi:hypothetical protein